MNKRFWINVAKYFHQEIIFIRKCDLKLLQHFLALNPKQ